MVPTTTTLSIVLADDHAVVRAGLKMLINAQPDMLVVGEASDGVEALELMRDCEPDMAVIDLSMPRLNGVEVTQQIRARCPLTLVLVLSVHDEATYLHRVLQVGATGYVLKQTAADSLITAIRRVASGEIYLDPALGNALLHTLRGEAGRGARETAALSEREAAVLRLIAAGYSNKEIAGRLDLSVKTVETYKTRALKKLGLKNRVELMRYAINQGWLGQLL